MESTKGITCKVEETLHQKVTEEREAHDMTMSDFITKVLNFYFTNQGGNSSMSKDGKRTLAFQIDE